MRWRASRMCTPRARSDWYSPLLSSSSASGASSTGRWLIITASGSPLAQRSRWIDDHLAVLGQVEFAGDLFVGRPDAVVEQLRGRLLAGAGKVVEQAGQLDAAVHGILHHLRAHAPLAHQQALVDELLDGAPSRRPRQRQPLRQRQLVFEAIAGRQFAVTDRSLDGLSKLIVEGTGLDLSSSTVRGTSSPISCGTR